MGILTYFFSALALAVLAVLAYASTRPDEFRVERRQRIAAPAERLWPLVGELRGFNRWNPYERKDPLIKGQYTGTSSGIGSRYAWASAMIFSGRLQTTWPPTLQRRKAPAESTH